MGVTLLNVDDPRWQELLRICRHDFYHVPEYVALEAARIGGKPCAIYATDGESVFLLPLALRIVEVCANGVRSGDVLDMVSPYGYPCPLANIQGEEARRFMRDILPKVRDYLTELGVISVFVRLHPILSDPSMLHDFGVLIQHGETVWCDLTKSEEELWNQFRKGHKQDIKSLQKNNYFAYRDYEWEYMNDFINLYYATMKRASAESLYYFDKEYFISLKEALLSKMNLWIVEKESDIVAAGLFSECNGIVQYHLSASNPNTRVTGTKLMIYGVILSAKERNNVVLHLGGGLGAGNDSLFYFKAGFSRLRKPFYTWRWIIDPRAYNTLVEGWVNRTAMKPDDESGYFPAYRKEVALGGESKGTRSYSS